MEILHLEDGSEIPFLKDGTKSARDKILEYLEQHGLLISRYFVSMWQRMDSYNQHVVVHSQCYKNPRGTVLQTDRA